MGKEHYRTLGPERDGASKGAAKKPAAKAKKVPLLKRFDQLVELVGSNRALATKLLEMHERVYHAEGKTLKETKPEVARVRLCGLRKWWILVLGSRKRESILSNNLFFTAVYRACPRALRAYGLRQTGIEVRSDGTYIRLTLIDLETHEPVAKLPVGWQDS